MRNSTILICTAEVRLDWQAQAEPYRVWIEDWGVAQNGDIITIDAATDEYALTLDLTQTLPPVLHGDGGLSPKSEEPGNASYYYSQVQQLADGTIRLGDETFVVTRKGVERPRIQHQRTRRRRKPAGIGCHCNLMMARR